ncbi:MAG: NAD(P)-binding domain-containing protein [bacterium]
MERRVGFLGCGQLGQALLAGWLAAEVVDRAGVRVAARQSAQVTAGRFGVQAAGAAEVVEACDLIILAVKPGEVAGLLAGLPFRAGGGRFGGCRDQRRHPPGAVRAGGGGPHHAQRGGASGRRRDAGARGAPPTAPPWPRPSASSGRWGMWKFLNRNSFSM